MSQTATIVIRGDLSANVASFTRHLRAANLSPRTIELYADVAARFADFLAAAGMPTDVAHIRREHVEAWISSILDRWKPATASNRYRSLAQFFKWCVDEGELVESPMRNMRPALVARQPVPVLSNENLRTLLKTCDGGRDFENRRDFALMLMFIDTSARRSEIANLRYDPTDDLGNDLDLDQRVIRVVDRATRAHPPDRRQDRKGTRSLRATTAPATKRRVAMAVAWPQRPVDR